MRKLPLKFKSKMVLIRRPKKFKMKIVSVLFVLNTLEKIMLKKLLKRRKRMKPKKTLI